MCSYIDLHMHTKYSDDGQFEPAKLVDMCKEAGVKSWQLLIIIQLMRFQKQ